MDSAKILIIDDDTDVLETARMFLKQQFKDILIESDPERIPTILQKHTFDVILLDMNFKRGVNDGHEGFFWLNRIITIDPDAVVILITAYGEVDIAVKAKKQGAVDFVLKTWKNQKQHATIHSAIHLRKSKREMQKSNAVR
jgi:DNA-binding NtrC family response regulator